ncbi:hypothetical protein EON80_26120, partial [bacterium]
LTPVNSGRVSGTTVGANLEANEDNPTYRDDGSSIWYRWTAPSAGPVTFSTADSKNELSLPYDTHLAVYRGTAINSLEWVEQNGDDGAYVTSKVSFEAESGVTYYLRIDNEIWSSYDSVKTFNTRHGQVNLSWSFKNAPINGPLISSFTPTSGQAGTAVTITGTNLDGTNSVKFDGIAATISSVSATSVVATAPNDVHTGKISLSSPRGSATSVTNFKVAPVITSFTPGTGAVGTPVTIQGRAFYGVTSVRFGDAEANFTVNSLTQLVTNVPAGAVSAKISVTTAGGTALSSALFNLPPRIDGFTPARGPIGTKVTINGANLTGATEVQFNGVKAISPVVTANSITASVPTGATTGVISVVTPVGTAKTITSFVVLRPPTVASFTPAAGKTGTIVTITGTNFTGASAVRFNGVAAVNPTVNATSITASVPAGATTGVIVVTTPDGTAHTIRKFVVDNAAPVVVTATPTQNQSMPINSFVSIAGS